MIPKRTLFDRTGIAAMNFNTVYQLYRRKRESDPDLEHADKLLLLPDLLGYLFTGEKLSEYTNVMTTSLYNPTAQGWDWATMRDLGLPDPFIYADRSRGATARPYASFHCARVGNGRCSAGRGRVS